MAALRGRCRSSPRHESAYHARLRGAFGRPGPLAACATAPSTRTSVTPSAVGSPSAAESRYDACRALRMRNWLKARVPSVYERLTGQRPWEEQRLGPDARLLESLPIEGHVGHRVPDDRAELGEASGLERFRRLPLERSEPPVLRQAPAAGQPSVKGKHDPRDQPRVHGRACRVAQRMPAVNRPSRRSAGRPRRPRRAPRERRAAPARARGSRGPRSGRTRRPSRDGRAGRASPSSRPGRRRW